MLNGCTPWPTDLAERYRRLGYWEDVALGDVLRAPAATTPERPAVATASRTLTFGEVDAAADRLARGLVAAGLHPGDRALVQLPNVLEFLPVVIGLFRAGVLPVFALPAHRAADVTALCEVAGARVYVIADRFGGFDYRDLARGLGDRVEHVVVVGDAQEFTSSAALEALGGANPELPVVDPAEVAFFLLSGGTTGVPKLIPRTHNDYAYQLRETARGLHIGQGSVYLAALPVSHNAALGCPGILGTYLAGGLTVLAGSPAPDEVLPLVKRHGITLTTLMPPLVKLWLDSVEYFDVDVSGVLLQIGSAKLPLEIARRIRPVLGCEVTHWFGMAEGLLCFTRPGEPDEIVHESTGKPMSPDDEIKVVGEDGEESGPEEVGELLTRGPYTLRGYYRADSVNARDFTPDGWLRTGDLVRLTAHGDLVIEGRIKDVINRGGEKVSPAELEEQLLAHPEIKDVAVVGVPDPVLGERICACVVPRTGTVDLRSVRTFLTGRGVAQIKLPDVVRVVDAFPHTKVGKVDKAALVRLVDEAGSAAPVRQMRST